MLHHTPKAYGSLGHDESSHQKKATVTKSNGAHLFKWLAALCVLNSVGAATVPWSAELVASGSNSSVSLISPKENVSTARVSRLLERNGRGYEPGDRGASLSAVQRVRVTRTPSKKSLEIAVKAYNDDATAAIKTYGPIADWVVSAITDMSDLFYNLQNFNADISDWDTSAVTTMYQMFSFDPLQGTSAFNQPLSFITSSVTDMRGMFSQASAFNQPLSFDTSSVTDMSYMFWQASAFNQPLSFKTSSVTDMSYMFEYASAFNQWLRFDTSSVTTMENMFGNANSLSNANMLLIRCTWAGTSAFASAGYGASRSCPSHFTVVGPCIVDGACARSPNYPSDYGINQDCTITPTSLAIGQLLSATAFNTERHYDKLIVNGATYDGTTGPSNVALGSAFTWSSDYSITRTGWEVCARSPN